jgi:hypothetical protein
MDFQNQMRLTVLFFSYALAEETSATLALKQVSTKISKKIKNETWSQDDRIHWIKNLIGIYKGLKKNSEQALESYSGRLQMLEDIRLDLSAWREFKVRADEEEFLAVLLTEVMGLNIKIVAEALNTSEGTIKHRVSRGLKALSERLL